MLVTTLIHVSKGINPNIIRRANEILDELGGEIRRPVRKMKRAPFYVINMGIRHRLLNRGRGWELLTHEQYNRHASTRKERG